MLEAFRKKGGLSRGFFYNIIYHGNAVFSSARVRVREKNAEKTRKIAGNGLSGRFDAMFENKKICRQSKKEKTSFPQLFRENDRSALDFSPFGSIL